MLQDHGSYYILRYDTILDAVSIINLIYSNASIYLTRKYNKAMEVINYRTNTELTNKTKKLLVM